ncbi:DUF2934 domain-containing protein [Pseudomonas sp. NPDC088368]|uniref:DUF2934 domain-containing protein n=1 Tax=Pseudomonas sp. NPDC088368 TaxID=3364453 RepID=UPI00382B9393
MIDENEIRKRAYELWQRDGSPEGSHADHWREAGEQLEAEQVPTNEGTASAAQDGPSSGVHVAMLEDANDRE